MRLKRKYKYRTLRKERFFKVLTIIFVMVLASVSMYLYDTIQTEQIDVKGEGEERSDLPIRENMASIDLFSNSAEFGNDLPIGQINVELFADGVSMGTFQSNSTGDVLDGLEFLYNTIYTYSIMAYGITDYINGTLSIGQNNIHIPTVQVEITAFYEDGVTVIPNSLFHFIIRYNDAPMGIMCETDQMTDVNGLIVLNAPIGILYYVDGSNHVIEQIKQTTASTISTEIILPSQTMFPHFLRFLQILSFLFFQLF